MNRANQVAGEVLAAVAQLRGSPDLRPNALDPSHRRMRSFVERAMRLAPDLGFTSNDAQDIGYVLAALLDETMLTHGDESRSYWLPRMLQLELFNDNQAGEGVFNRLEALLSDPARVDVLRVYYMVLIAGYQGRYRVRGRELELDDVIERTVSALRRFGAIRDTPLSPQAARPDEAAVTIRRTLPFVWGAVAVLVLTLGGYAYLEHDLGTRTRALITRIQASTARTAR